MGALIVLHWLRLKLLKDLPLGIKILALSGIIHLFGLFSLLFIYKGSTVYSVIVTGTMIDTDVPVVFLPLYKSIKQQPLSNKKNPGSPNGVVQTIAQSDESIKETGIRHEKKGTTIGVVPGNKAQKNASPRTNGSTSSPRAVKKKNNQKNIGRQAKDQLKMKKKPARPDPWASSGVNAQPARHSLKSDGRVEGNERLKKDEPTVKEIPIKPIPQVVQQSEPIVPPVNQSAIDAAGQEVVYVGQEEMEALQLQEYIQQEMAQHWSPPPGIPKESNCTIKISVGFDGTINDLDMEQSSGVLLFDSAARRAASQLTPPPWAYGKTLRITFKP